MNTPINSPLGQGETPAPKRKIIRRIVRRVPKQSVSAHTTPAVPAQFSTPTVAPQTPVETTATAPLARRRLVEQPTTGRVLEPSPEAEALLAEEEPIAPAAAAIEFPSIEPKPVEPKGAFLEQLSRKDKPGPAASSSYKNTHSIAAELPSVPTTSPDGRSPIDSIWPYIAAAKQHSGELRDDESDMPDDTPAIGGRRDVGSVPEKNYFSWIPWVLGPIVVFALIVVGISYFSGATVIVTPKTQQVTVNADLATEKNADPLKSFPLAVLSVSDKVSVDVSATESNTSVAAASGIITVVNKQQKAQRLIKATRFESATGKIYRIHDGILVPAAKSPTTPGTLDVTVYAESSGPDYNMTGTTNQFTLPGFKGKPQFTQVTAVEKGDISGGSAGVKKSISDDTMTQTAQQLRIQLENKLRSEAAQQVLPTQVAYESLYQFTYKDPVLAPSDAPEKAKVVLEGTLATPTFDRDMLAKALAKSTVKDYNGEDLTVTGLDAIPVTLSGDPKTDLLSVDKATFHFQGNASFVWKVDTDMFTRALLNVAKSDVPKVMARFPSIDHVDATLRPFWKQYFPGDVKDFVVTVKQ